MFYCKIMIHAAHSDKELLQKVNTAGASYITSLMISLEGLLFGSLNEVELNWQ